MLRRWTMARRGGNEEGKQAKDKAGRAVKVSADE